MGECNPIVDLLLVIGLYMVSLILMAFTISASRKSIMYRECGKVMRVLAEAMSKCPKEHEQGAVWLWNEIDRELVQKEWGMK